MSNSRIKKDINDFSEKTKQKLARRASCVCSNPICGRNTDGGHSKAEKYSSVGEAAHIKGARPTSARYDENMTPQHRRHISNGVWLCSNCHTEIDNDEKLYPAELLQKWKKEHEETILSKNYKKKYEELNKFFQSKGYVKTNISITSINVLKNPLIDEAFKAWGEGDIKQAFKLSKDAYFEGDTEVKLQAIVNMLSLSVEESNTLDYFLAISEEGIQIAKLSNASPMEAILQVHKARLLQAKLIGRYLELYYDLNILLSTGLFVRTKEDIQNEVKDIKKDFEKIQNLELAADELAIKSKDYSAIANVKMIIANTQGALFPLNQLFGGDTGSIEVLVISELIKAKKIYEGLGDEFNTAVVLHNLANKLRFFGDSERAKNYALEALSIAERNKFTYLVIKIKELLESDFEEDAKNPYMEFFENMNFKRSRDSEPPETPSQK